MVILSIDPCLQLENFNETKRKNVISKYKDIRVKAANEIKTMWFSLGLKIKIQSSIPFNKIKKLNFIFKIKEK